MIAYDRLSQIIPPELALANKAVSVSFQQVTGIAGMNLPTFAITVEGLDNISDLNIINALTTAVPPSVAQYYINTLGVPTNTPPNVKIVDVIGTPSGYVHTQALNDTVAQTATINTSTLKNIYDTMLLVVQGFFDVTVPPVPPDVDPTTETVITPGYPAAGTYATHDEAILALIAVAQAEMTNLQTQYPQQTQAMNADFNAIANQLVTEKNLQARANLNFTQLIPNDQSSVYGFIFTLPSFGLDVGPKGSREYLTALSDQNSQTGQAIVGALREGQDQTLLNAAGIKSNNIIPL